MAQVSPALLGIMVKFRRQESAKQLVLFVYLALLDWVVVGKCYIMTVLNRNCQTCVAIGSKSLCYRFV